MFSFIVQDISFGNNRTTGTVGNKSNGSRYTPVKTSSSSPYHRPNKQHVPPPHEHGSHHVRSRDHSPHYVRDRDHSPHSHYVRNRDHSPHHVRDQEDIPHHEPRYEECYSPQIDQSIQINRASHHHQPRDVREGQVRSDDCFPEDIDCFKCECYKNLKATGCDPGKIDQNSRVLFPLTFMLLNIIYWTYYIIITDVTVDELINQDIAMLADA